jgi:hypothetical protein
MSTLGLNELIKTMISDFMCCFQKYAVEINIRTSFCEMAGDISDTLVED